MKKKLLVIFLLMLWAVPSCFAESLQEKVAAVVKARNVTVNPCANLLICQNFEGTGYDNSESWSETIGTGGIVDEDDTTATVLRGSQQLKIYGGNAGQNSFTYASFAGQDTVYGHFMYKPTDATPSGTTDVFLIEDSGGTALLKLTLGTDGKFVLYHGTKTCNGNTALSDGTAYHLWVKYTKGTGGNGVADFYVGTDTNRPASKDCTSSITAGTATAQAARVKLRASLQNTWYFDQVIVDETEFTTVTP